MDPTLVERVRAWMAADPDPVTRAELEMLLETPEAEAELADRFAGSLEFGTAGLRGVLGAGPNRMNRAVVLRTTWGLAQHLLASIPDVKRRGVVIGFDGRRMSREFADETAGVLAAAGIQTFLFEDYAPTPLTAFAIGHYGACAAVMITASHNPPEYNGYKAYWSNGAQIIPPVDTAIAAQIERAPAARAVPCLSLSEMRTVGLVTNAGAKAERAYLKAIGTLSDPARGDRSLSIVYTPMHGVGGKLAAAAFAEAGFTRFVLVPEQAQPDGTFPTVAFPNPEEKGAMDLAFSRARAEKAELVLANDPDADRLAVAVPYAASPSGYVQLTGNQVGVLLGHARLTAPGAAGADRLVIASIVSSPMLGVIAQKLGVRYEETLTGFKWIANRAMELEEEGARFVFGYEEALGYTVGDVVRDKDGISAALVFAAMAAELRAEGRTVLDRLEALYREYGFFVSAQVNVTKNGASGIAALKKTMDRLRAAPPVVVGPFAVRAVRDYAARQMRDDSGNITPLSLPASNVLAFELDGGSRIIARPSGTEPKIKYYFDVCEAMKPGETMADAEKRAAATVQKLAEAWGAVVAKLEGESAS